MIDILTEINNLASDLGDYKTDLIALYDISKTDKIMAFAKARQIAECIISDLSKGFKQSQNLEKNIELCQAKGLIPSEICTILHYLRVMGNKQHAGSLKIKISDRDIANLLNNIIRLYEWFFCEYKDGLKLKNITIGLNRFVIEAYRFIPFYIGNFLSEEAIEFLGYNSIETQSGNLCFFDDDFSVLVVKEKIRCKNVIDYLKKRRDRHLSIIENNSCLVEELISLRKESSNILMKNFVVNIEYVMSVHFLDSKLYNISRKDKKCIVEPSILGITDDPSENIKDNDINKAERLYLSLDSDIPKGIECICCEDHECYLSWANVLFCMNERDDYLKNVIVSHEIKLQKLWFKLHVYNKAIEEVIKNMAPIDDINTKREIFRTKIEYSDIKKIDAKGASFTNSVRLALNKTSNVDKLYESFINNVSLLSDMKDIT